ncbi:MAG: FAD-dependent oxidoreductase [Planctomycetota bacterium]|nr:FAD-dependent oxidoreductase [Planctomycetota bacterium]
MKIAVIGSGIAGLASAWLLSKEHTITVFEAAPTLGMDAASLTIAQNSGSNRIDVPLRVIHDHYYKSLLALYKEAGIETESVNYSGSFTRLGGESYFRYWNVRFFNTNVPLSSPKMLFYKQSRQILKDYWRFTRQAKQERNNRTPLGDYLKQYQYSDAFCEDFLLPTFAAIGTCKTDQVRAYPSGVVNDYLTAGGWLWGIRRAKFGSADVVKRLSKGSQVLCDCPVSAVEREGEQILVKSKQGAESYDHVILATPANVTVKLLGDCDSDALEPLRAFEYESSRVLVHSDPRFMPKKQRDWAPVNFMIDRDAPAPMATIWLNVVQPGLPKGKNVFQTWHPLMEAQADLLLKESVFERPVINQRTTAALTQFDSIHEQSKRRIWYVGSYASPGVPLLESAVKSALKVARRLTGDGSVTPVSPGS